MTSCSGSICHSTGNADTRPAALSALVRLRDLLIAWSERARRRHELREVLEMPEHLLRDMGVARDEVYREYRKPFWRQ